MSAENVLFDAPGPNARRRHAIISGIGALLAVAVFVLVLWKMKQANQLQGSMWKPFVTDPQVWTEYLIPGLIGTLKAAVISVVLAGVFGIVFGLGRLSENKALRLISGSVVEFFRAVPVLIMMIIGYFGYFAKSPLFSSTTASLGAVVTALTLYNGSVIAELIRSGVHSLPKGQREAGLSIGLTSGQTLRQIQLPQALTAMLPALISQFVVILKDSALGYAITYQELLIWSKTLGSAYANTVPAYLVAALLFIAMNYALTSLAAYVEGRLKKSGHTAAKVTDADEAEIEPADLLGEPAMHGAERVAAFGADAAERTREGAHQLRERFDPPRQVGKDD